MEANEREKIKKQAVAATVAALASASVMVGGVLPDDGVFDDGMDEAPTPIVETVPLAAAGGDGGDVDEVPAETDEEKKKARRLSAWFARLPFSARLMISVGIGGAAWLAAGGLSALFAAVMPPVLAGLLGFAVTALGILGAFAALCKAFFPEKRLRDMVSKKNLWWILGGAALLAVLGEVLPLVWSGYGTVSALVQLGGSAALLAGTAAAAIRREKRIDRERAEAEAAKENEVVPETMEQARARVLAMVDETAQRW